MRSLRLLVLAVAAWLLVLCGGVHGRWTGGVNVTDFLAHRQRRSLVYPNGGNARIVIGTIFNLALGDRADYRSLAMLYLLHLGEYTMPATPLYPWDKWEHLYARSLQRISDEFAQTGRYTSDDSRLFMYIALEEFITQQGADGRACLLRSICENAQVHSHVGIFTELLDVLLTPGHEDIDPVYGQARDLGRSGADCLLSFANCPMGANILDRYWHKL